MKEQIQFTVTLDNRGWKIEGVVGPGLTTGDAVDPKNPVGRGA